MNAVAGVRSALVTMRDQAQAELSAALDAPTRSATANWPVYERESAFLQTVKLGNGEDCNYDRPTVGVAYACWYMPRRINEAFHFLVPELVSRQGATATIIDIGCGTGATWWACRYISAAMTSMGLSPPEITIIARDTSLPMLQLGRHLWESLSPSTTAPIRVSTKLSSWTSLIEPPKEGVIFASYLFDQSDKYRIEELGKTLRRMADQFDARDIYIIGASNKRSITERFVAAFTDKHRIWGEQPHHPSTQVWSGSIPQLQVLRQHFATGCTGLTSKFAEALAPSWSDISADYRHLSRSNKALPEQPTNMSNFVLDARQDSAATPDDRLTAILGAAGSGKSRVLVERVVRTVLADFNGEREGGEYLVTCFNKPVIQQLQRWFTERLSGGADTSTQLSFEIDQEVVEIRVSSRLRPTTESNKKSSSKDLPVIRVHFSTWDAIIYRRFFGTRLTPSAESERSMQKIIEFWGNLDGENRDWLDQNTWITPKFVLQELKRVIYGQSVSTLEEYLNVQRRGRPKEPQMRRDRREGLWNLINHPERQKLWVDRRIAAHRAIRGGFRPSPFNRVFLDECQDFVEADFHLISTLVHDPRHLVVSGDGTQALQTGSGYFRPRTVNGTRWVTHELSGSYRLPIRICEAIEPVAKAIQRLRKGQSRSQDSDDSESEDIALPHAVRSAVIGCRPIVLAAPNKSAFITQVSRILEFIAPLIDVNGEYVVTNADQENITLASYLKAAVNETEPKYVVENNSMLKIKGLERPCVLFSTRLDGSLTPGASTYEWTYTILTRPTSVLILNLSNATNSEIKALLGRMRRDCLFFWDQEAEDQFDDFAECVGGSSDPFK